MRGPIKLDPVMAPNLANIAAIDNAIPLIFVGYSSTTRALMAVMVTAPIRKNPSVN